MRCVLASLILTFLAVPTHSRAQEGCPVDSLYASCGWIETTAPWAGLVGNCNLINSGDWPVAQYNLISGTSRTRCFGVGYRPIMASCRLHDIFTLEGPASESPHVLWVQLTAAYFLWSDRGMAVNDIPGRCGAGVTLFAQGASVTDSLHADVFTLLELDNVLVLPLTVTPNEPFSVRYATYAWSHRVAKANLDVTVGFAGVPPGYTVTSCQGFSTTGDVPVPARRASWGRLKSLYR